MKVAKVEMFLHINQLRQLMTALVLLVFVLIYVFIALHNENVKVDKKLLSLQESKEIVKKIECAARDLAILQNTVAARLDIIEDLSAWQETKKMIKKILRIDREMKILLDAAKYKFMKIEDFSAVGL